MSALRKALDTVNEPLQRIKIERPATGGGVGRLSDGKVIFVKHCLPGEVVDVSITTTNAKMARGDAIEIIEPSPDRVEPQCQYARPGMCGGCDLQHANKASQVKWKLDIAKAHLERLAGTDHEIKIIANDIDDLGSRTRLRCGVDDEGRLGLRTSRSRELIAIDHCPLASDRLIPAFSTSWKGAEEVELRAIGEGEPFGVVRYHSKRGTSIDLARLDGSPLNSKYTSFANVDGYQYRISPLSFWQSHVGAPSLLVKEVMQTAELKRGDHAIDLFGGVGLFSLPLAKAVGASGRVTCVESSSHAAQDARYNSTDISQIEVQEATVTKRTISNLLMENSVVVLDPPRSGINGAALAELTTSRARQIIYVSCDAATLSRDLATLKTQYEIKEIKAFDLFPMTEHLEFMVNLEIMR